MSIVFENDIGRFQLAAALDVNLLMRVDEDI
jgi:hypothetical protein